MGVRRRDVGVGMAGLLLGLLLAFLLSTNQPPRIVTTVVQAPIDSAPPREAPPLSAPPAPAPASPVAVPVAAPLPPEPPPAEEPPVAGGPVRIRLRNAEDGAACGGAIVVGTPVRPVTGGEAAPVTVVADADGEIVLPAGRVWQLELREIGLSLFDPQRIYGGGTPVAEAWCGRMAVIRGAVRLEAPAAAAGQPAVVEARVEAGVPDAAGEPSQGSPAWLAKHLPRGVRRRAVVENGVFSLAVPAWLRSVHLRASARGHIPEERLLPDTRPGEAVPFQSILLRAGGAVPVLIVDAAGRPVPGARLTAVLSRTIPEEEFSYEAESVRGGSWVSLDLPGEGRVQVDRVNPARVGPDGGARAEFRAVPMEGEAASLVVVAEGYLPFVGRVDAGGSEEAVRVELLQGGTPLPAYRFRGPDGLLPEGTRIQLLRIVDGVAYPAPGRTAGREGRFDASGLVPGETYAVTLVVPAASGDRSILEGRAAFGEEEVIDASGFEARTEGPLPREGR